MIRVLLLLLQYFAKELPALAGQCSTAGGDGHDGAAVAAGSGTTQALAAMLVQCVGLEAPALLPPLLFLHCLSQVCAVTVTD